MDSHSTTRNPVKAIDSDEYDELVAYLDGELDEASCERLEAQLLEDEALQKKLNELSKVWDMLDSLPKVPAAEEFTKSTMEMAVVSTKRQITGTSGKRLLSLRILLLCAAVLSGFFVSRWMQQDNDRMLVEDFEVIDNLDLYRVGGSVEFLEELDVQGLFTGGQNRE
tara:strand:- start:427 stop:927 length:501 start_codon:yes stop_codon:yes gene_type:complete